MKEVIDTIPVPFISEDLVERDSNTTSEMEALLEAEFGDPDEFIITPNRVSIGGKTIIDLDADAIFAAAEQQPTPKHYSDPKALRDFNKPQLPVSDDALVFKTRVIANKQTLRIAIHSDMVQLYRPALNKLLNAVKTQPQENIELDLGQCNHISLTGIGVLLLVKENAKAGCDITLKNCVSEVAKKLRWANLTSQFTLHKKKL